jgi:hypothetical protein
MLGKQKAHISVYKMSFIRKFIPYKENKPFHEEELVYSVSTTAIVDVFY